MKTQANTFQGETRSISRLLILGIVAIALPLCLSLLSRLLGSYSPWMAGALYLPFIAALITLVVGTRHLFRDHYTRAIRCLGLAVVQGALAFVVYALLTRASL